MLLVRNINSKPLFFKSVSIENLKCFKGKYDFDFTDGHNIPAQWTVILGNNNTGKTTILRALADIYDNLIVSFKPNRVKRFENNKNCVFCNDFFVLEKKEKNIKSNLYTIIDISDNNIVKNDFVFSGLQIDGYGTSRRTGKGTITNNEETDSTLSLLQDNVELTNIEEWLLQTVYAVKNKSEIAVIRLKKIKEILTGGILPDITDFRFITDEKLNNFIEFETSFGWVRYEGLGFGYQTTIAWLVDLIKRLFERYPQSENPLHEPAVVLVDEIDLHLHPEWQRKIINYLSDLFPNTQFIVTTHSPLVIQSADDINLIVLQRIDDHIVVEQPAIKNFKGWNVEEILTEIMGLGEKIHSDTYLALTKQFDEALNTNHYTKAKDAYNQLETILHPESHQRKLLRIQMSSLIPDAQ